MTKANRMRAVDAALGCYGWAHLVSALGAIGKLGRGDLDAARSVTWHMLTWEG